MARNPILLGVGPKGIKTNHLFKWIIYAMEPRVQPSCHAQGHACLVQPPTMEKLGGWPGVVHEQATSKLFKIQDLGAHQQSLESYG